MTGNPGSAGPGRYSRLYDVRIAEEHTIAGAVVYEEIRRFCARNQAEGIEDVKQDGKYYCYTSAQRIAKHLRISLATVERKLKKLCAAGLIHKKARTGTAVDNNNPRALLYFAEDYGQFTHQAKTPNAYRQNEGTPYRQNEGTERKYLKRSKEQGACKDQTTYAKATGETRTTTTTTTREHTPRSTRSADGPVPFAQVIAEALKNTQPQPRKPKPIPDAQIKVIEAAQAAQAAEDEERIVPELRNLVKHYLARRIVPQPIREMMETALQEESIPFYDGWNPDVLRAWVKQLQAMPKQEETIETTIFWKPQDNHQAQLA